MDQLERRQQEGIQRPRARRGSIDLDEGLLTAMPVGVRYMLPTIGRCQWCSLSLREQAHVFRHCTVLYLPRHCSLDDIRARDCRERCIERRKQRDVSPEAEKCAITSFRSSRS